MNVFIKVLTDDLHWTAHQNCRIMNERLLTIQSKKKQNPAWIRLNELNLTSPSSLNTKNKLISAWFDTDVSGSFLVPRALDLIDSKEPISFDVPLCSTTNEMKSAVGNYTFWEFEVNYMTVVDPNYFVIGGQQAIDLDFPAEMKFAHGGSLDDG